MKLLAKLIGCSVFLLLLVLLAGLTLLVEVTPKLQHKADLTPEQIAHGKRVFEQNDPRRMKSGSITKASLRQEDLDLAINYSANQYVDAVAGLHINKGRAVIDSTLQLPVKPLKLFLNLSIELKQTASLPQIDKITIGKLSLPPALVDKLINYGLTKAKLLANWQTLSSMISRVEFAPQQLIVTYRWQDDLPAKLSNALLSDRDHSRLEVYQKLLAELPQANISNLSLIDLMKPLFQLAQQRTINNNEAVAENRAVILVLTFYVNQKELTKIVPQFKARPRPSWQSVTLNDRDDFPKHYLVSAMLAAYSGTPLSNVVGLYKEIDDAKTGSGFSFNDIAADLAGTRMGELAVSNEASAKQIQQRLATAKESDIMPVTADLPEFMPEAEFMRRFGGIQGLPYRQMMADIKQRVAALPINSN